MANCIIVGGGSGGALSSDVTASKANVLAGTKTITSDSANAVVDGTMVNRGTINHTLSINGSYTIPQGYHSGSGKVSQSVSTKGAATYYATTADQTIAANQYLTGVQTIKKLTQTGLSAANILNGTTIKINNGNADVWSVTGTRVTPVRNTYVVAIKGFGAPQNILSDEDTYTMERAGVVYFGMATLGVSGSPKAKAELLVNNVVKKSIELDGSYSSYSYQYQVWASENLAKNDVVKVRVTITQGTHVFAILGAHMAC